MSKIKDYHMKLLLKLYSLVDFIKLCVIDVILVFLLLVLNIFHSFFFFFLLLISSSYLFAGKEGIEKKILRGALSGLKQVLTTESPFKNGFYLTWKDFFVLNIFKFLSWYFGYLDKQLDSKDKVNLKFCGAKLEKQTIAIHILPNMARSKSNQTMKFGQLIVYNMTNIFLEKSYTKRGGETISRLFSKNLK